eukprot:Gb_24281 [translate_table: standard]
MRTRGVGMKMQSGFGCRIFRMWPTTQRIFLMSVNTQRDSINIACRLVINLFSDPETNTETRMKASSELRNKSETVGMEENINVITSWLLDEPNARVIAVVGKGGLEVLGRGLKLSLEYQTVEEARVSIYNRLRGKRCLLVLDDVWRGKNLVEQIGVPEDECCKVVITTRSTEVAKDMGGDCRHIYHLPDLSEDNSWRLFCLHAFPDCDRTPPRELEEVARGIEKKCARLPLAVKTIASAMARRRRLPNEWNSALRRLNEFRRLAKMDEWNSCKMHDLLRQLALSTSEEGNICLFQTGKALKKFPSQKSPGHRRISLMQNDVQAMPKSSSGCLSLRTLFLSNNSLCLRTLFLSNNRNLTNISGSFISNLGYLRVLDLSWTNIRLLPKSVGNLKHLKVLNVSYSKLEKLPKTIRHLRCLQSLDASGCYNLKSLPGGMGELKCLTHLNLSGCDEVEFMPKGISRLTSLQTLKMEGYKLVRRKADKALKLEDLKGLTQLRDLDANLESEERIADGIFGDMRRMRRLTLYNYNHDILVHLPEDMAQMEELEKFSLYFHVVPRWICGLQNLMLLKLQTCDCRDYPALETMPNLRLLILWRNKSCNVLRNEFGKSGGFPKLEKLVLTNFQVLEELPVLEDGAMPMLRLLEVSESPRLKKMPEGLEGLRNLEELRVYWCRKWQKRLKQGGEDVQKLRDKRPHMKIKVQWDDSSDSDSVTDN